jgi:hypothetical protein
VERSRLSEGKVMHYRAHLDVHRQLPPDTLSVSLNVLHMRPEQGWLDQYRFDVDRGIVADVVNPRASAALLRLATGLGAPEALELAEHFACSHPSDRIRLAAWEGLAGSVPATESDNVWARAEESGNLLVAKEAAMRRAALTG